MGHIFAKILILLIIFIALAIGSYVKFKYGKELNLTLENPYVITPILIMFACLFIFVAYNS